MKKNKRTDWLIHFINVYGFNAIIGFGLGIAIVLIVFAVSGKQNILGKEPQGGSSQIVSSQEGDLREGQMQEQVNSQEGTESLNSIEKSFPQDIFSDTSSNLAMKEHFTVLIIGMDNRPGEVMSNTDTLIVASLDQKNKKMVLLSIPRDTQVFVNSKKEKVNAIARLRKGPISTQEYIQELIATSIDGYVLTNFQGFKNIVDSLGGITINVEKDMYYDTGDEQDRFINLKKGSQRLNGTQALQYARFRNDELADISRASRQQEVIKAIVAEATTPRNIPKLPIIIPKVYQAIETNLNLGQIWSLSMAFKNKENYDVINQTLPGQFSDEEGISYWKVNPKESKVILNQLFQGQTAPIFENIQKVKAPVQVPVVKETPEKTPETNAEQVEDGRQDGNETTTITIEVLTTDVNKGEAQTKQEITPKEVEHGAGATDAGQQGAKSLEKNIEKPVRKSQPVQDHSKTSGQLTPEAEITFEILE